MGGSDFNATTSIVKAINQPGFLTGPHTMCALLLPDSIGETNAGCMLGTHTSAGATRRRMHIVSGQLQFCTVLRTTTSTTYQASNRRLELAGALTAKNAAFCAVTFDSAASPPMHLYNTCDGTNAGELAEPTYGTATAGAGTVNSEVAGQAIYTVGNTNAASNTWDGGIIWAAFIPEVLSFEALQALASGVNPVAVFGHIADARCVDLTDFANPREMTDNAVTWTATALAANDAVLAPAGDGFATNGLITRP